MSLEEAEKALLAALERGVARSADQLARVSRSRWQTQTVSLRRVAFDRIEAPTAADGTEHYGSYFAIPGGVFLVMFPRAGADALARAFAPKGPSRPEAAARWTQDCLAEIANVIVHSAANAVADECGDALFLSAPTNAVGSRQDLVLAAPSKFSPAGKAFVLMAYVHMQAESLSSDCAFVLFFNAQRRDRLLKALAR